MLVGSYVATYFMICELCPTVILSLNIVKLKVILIYFIMLSTAYLLFKIDNLQSIKVSHTVEKYMDKQIVFGMLTHIKQKRSKCRAIITANNHFLKL